MNDKQTDLEIEVKFQVFDTEQMRQQIIDLGAESRGRLFEHNIRFDSAARELRARAHLLRLRQDRKAKLTFKAPPAEKNQQFKIFSELEVTVSDFDAMRKIVHALGFGHEQIYEKWRETFILEDLELCMDSLPFGNFLEIEGAPEAIVQTAGLLGLDWSKRILTNYLGIFASIKQHYQLAFNDVTFANFEKSVDISSDFMQQFEAGA